MRNRETKGFTLIELIMVIVILGILAAVAIPKFVDLSSNAQKSACDGIRGNIASAASIYYANEAAQGRSATFPDSSTLVATLIEGWTSFHATCPGNGAVTYNATNGTATCLVHT